MAEPRIQDVMILLARAGISWKYVSYICCMFFKSDIQRKEFWDLMHKTYSKEKIDAAMAALPKETARLLEMFYTEEYSLKQVEIITQQSGRTVRSEMQKGMEKLYKYFEK